MVYLELLTYRIGHPITDHILLENNSLELKRLFLKCACLDCMLAQEVYADKKYLRGFGLSMWRLFDYVQNLL